MSNPVICSHCHEPIRQDQAFGLIPSQTELSPMHIKCKDKIYGNGNFIERLKLHDFRSTKPDPKEVAHHAREHFILMGIVLFGSFILAWEPGVSEFFIVNHIYYGLAFAAITIIVYIVRRAIFMRNFMRQESQWNEVESRLADPHWGIQ